MYIFSLPNAAGCKVTVTATATSVYDLITAAASVAHNLPNDLNAIDICVESNDCRILFDGNTPTAANGFLLKAGVTYNFRNVPLVKARMIRVSGDSTCSIQVGRSTFDEVSSASLTSASITVDSEFPAAAPLADATANPTTTTVGSMAHGFNGTTWDQLRTANVAATSTFTGLLNVLPLVRYNATSPTLTDGQVVVPQGDVNGNMKTNPATNTAGEDLANNVLRVALVPINDTGFAWSVDISAALEASTITKASPGTLKRVLGRIDSTFASGTYYFMMLDSATLPADGVVTRLTSSLKLVHVTGMDTPILYDAPGEGTALPKANAGIVCCLSTTEVTKTIAGAGFFGEVSYT